MKSKALKQFTSLITIAAFFFAQPALVFAQPADAADSQPAHTSARPDVVRTVDDSVIRGVIEEKIAGEFVVIRSPRGRVYEFEWGDVAFAGSSEEYADYVAVERNGERGADRVEQTVREAEELETNEREATRVEDSTRSDASSGDESSSSGVPSIRFHAVGTTPPLQIETKQAVTQTDQYGRAQTYRDWQNACTTDCTLATSEVAGGEVRLSFRNGGSGTREISLPPGISGDVGIVYQSRQPHRIGIGIGGLVATGIGIGLIVHGRNQAKDLEPLADFADEDSPTFTKVGKAGFFPLLSGMVMMITAAALKDKVDIRYENGGLQF